MRYKQTFDLANFTVFVTDEPKLHIQRCKKESKEYIGKNIKYNSGQTFTSKNYCYVYVENKNKIAIAIHEFSHVADDFLDYIGEYRDTEIRAYMIEALYIRYMKEINS
jgi:hypothetical protein